MPRYALYDVLQSFQETHRVVINLAGELNDEQLRWRPKGYPTSIGFHLWHLARESDNLKAEILSHFPQIGPDFGEGIEIWQRDALAQRWNFPRGLHETLGSGLSDEAAAALPIPDKEELLDYLHASYKAIESLWNCSIPNTRTSKIWRMTCARQLKTSGSTCWNTWLMIVVTWA